VSNISFLPKFEGKKNKFERTLKYIIKLHSILIFKIQWGEREERREERREKKT
jgi:hypothetical protein